MRFNTTSDFDRQKNIKNNQLGTLYHPIFLCDYPINVDFLDCKLGMNTKYMELLLRTLSIIPFSLLTYRNFSCVNTVPIVYCTVCRYTFWQIQQIANKFNYFKISLLKCNFQKMLFSLPPISPQVNLKTCSKCYFMKS